jgi:hypothetical protein
VAGGKSERVLFCQFGHGLVGAGPAHKHFAGRFAEGGAELYTGHGLNHCLMKVFDRFDEVALAEDQINPVRLDDSYGTKLHGLSGLDGAV